MSKATEEPKEKIYKSLFGALELPLEIELDILGLLGTGTLVKLQVVSKAWQRSININRCLWRNITLPVGAKVKNFDKICSFAQNRAKVLALDSNTLSIQTTTLFGFRALVSLTIRNMPQLPDKQLSAIVRNSRDSLKTINLTCSVATNETVIMSLNLCVKLLDLNISQCPLIADIAFKTLLPTPLKKLDISYCISVTDKGVKNVAQAFPGLESIDVSCLPRVTTKSLLFISKLKALTSLHFNAMQPYAAVPVPDAILKLVMDCPMLSTLSLSTCPLINTQICKHLSDFAKNLRNLNFASCGNITDTSLEHLSHCKLLETLNVSNCTKVSDNGVAAVVNGCSKLIRLSLSNLNYLTGVSIDRIRESENTIQYLDISKIEGIEERYIMSLLKKKRRPLRQLRVNSNRISQESKVLLRTKLKLECV